MAIANTKVKNYIPEASKHLRSESGQRLPFSPGMGISPLISAPFFTSSPPFTSPPPAHAYNRAVPCPAVLPSNALNLPNQNSSTLHCNTATMPEDIMLTRQAQTERRREDKTAGE